MPALAGVYSRAATTLLNHRLLAYFFLSLASVSAVILNALRNYSNFYAVAVSLSKSSRSVLALANFAFLVALAFGHLVQRVFFGSLRANEVERLYDRLWFFVTESLLAFTIFRDEFDFPFAMMFGFLLFVKSFHWLAGDRIEWMDQRPYPGPPLSFHIRMISLFSLLWCIDLLMFLFAVENTLTQGVGGMVLFASEYGILMASILNTIAKYFLSAYELRRAGRRGGENAPPWENKSMWTFYIELVTDFLKLTTYLAFFTIIITFYGVPLNIIRDVYLTARSFVTRLRALHRYQTATRNMDQRYPNATPEELATMSDNACIICREEMTLPEPTHGQGQPQAGDGPNMTPKKLPCGHIFHFHCLRSWLERQQSCPTCRRTVLDTQPATGTPPVPAQQPQAPAAPQPQDNVQPLQNQNQPDNNLLGNPLGLVNRLLGAPPQPNEPTPAANNGNTHRAPIADARNRGDQQFHEVLIRYRVPAGAQPQPQPQERVLQNTPAYQGFVGPNGAWQQWPVRQLNGPPPPLDAQGPAGQSSQSNDDLTAQGDVPTDPREAARCAALRRLASVPNSETQASNSPRSNGETNDRSPNSSPADVPALIPLYPFSPGGDVSTPSLSANSSSGHAPSNSQPNRAGSSALGNGSIIPNTESTSPNTIDELATLDRITREAIDERLQVLERVSNTLYGCIDELTQMRSTLPPVTERANQAHKGPTGSAEQYYAGSSHLQDKGKQQEIVAGSTV